MITEKEIKEKYKQICNLLSERKLKPAFDLLDQLISESGLGEFRDEFESLEQNYKFMLKYTVEGINDPERQKVYEHLLISSFEKSLIVTGLTLGLMRYFDENKIVLLFNAYDNEDEEVCQRALIGLLIGIYYYDQRMPFFHAIMGRLSILIEDPRFRSNFEKSILQFIRSKETEEIQRKLQDEIIPEMIKLSPNLRNKLSIE